MSKPNSGAKAPDFAKQYKEGLQTYMKFLPQELQSELGYRQQYDPLLTQQSLDLQHQFDPQLAGEQLAAVNRRDPQWMAMHQELGDKVKEALDRGYVDPNQAAAYGALGKQVTGDTLRGGTANPAELRDMTQSIMSRQPSLSYGEAQDMATAVYTGQRATQLQAQRQGATNQFLQQQSPEMQAMAVGGTYLSSPTVTSMINQTPGVTPPSNMRYVNPNAGYQGVQFGLQNYQNQLAQQQVGNSSNPWMNALQGAGAGASYGSVGGGYGAAGGFLTGAVAGALGYPQFSDARLKNNISRTEFSTRDGIPIVDFNYNGNSSHRYRGVLAEDVEKVRPDAVYEQDGFKMVDYSKLSLVMEEV